MRRLLLALGLSLVLVGTGCQSWKVDAFGFPVGGGSSYATVARPASPPDLGHHAKLSLDSLTKDEKQGVYVTVAVAILAIVALLVWG